MSTKYIITQDIVVNSFRASRRQDKPLSVTLRKDSEVYFLRFNKNKPNIMECVTDDDEEVILQIPKNNCVLWINRKYFPIKDELYENLMAMRIRHEPSYIRCFKHNITDKFINSFKMIVSEGFGHRQNNIIFVSGQTGTGKSISSISLCKMIYDNFSYKNIFFFDQQILDNVNSFPPNSVVIRDENPSKGTYGFGSRRIETQVDVIADTCRKAGLSLIFIEPEFRKSDIAKFYLETIDYGAIMDCDSEGKPVTDNKGNYQNVVRTNRIGVREPKSCEFIGAILIPIIPENDTDWVSYNKTKDEFIDNIKKGNYGDAKYLIIKQAQEIANNPDYDLFTKPNDLKLLIAQRYNNITTSEVNMMVDAVRLIRKGINLNPECNKIEITDNNGKTTNQ